MEHTGSITFKGNPMTLISEDIKEGQPAPDFTVLGQDLKPITLSQFKGQTVVLSAVPSLDTPVCQTMTKRFNEEAAKLTAKVLTISMDLPFAQKRFCESFKVNNIITASDYKDRDFGQKYGLIKELGLLARAVTVVGPDGNVAYSQVVKEVTEEPNYDAVITAVKKLSS